MNAYLIRILTMSLLCGLIELLAPTGEREGLRRGVRLVTGLCLLCLMITPLWEVRDLIFSFDLGTRAREAEQDSQEEYARLMEQKLTVVTREQLQSELYAMLEEQFDIAREDCALTVEWEEESDTPSVRQVWISLHGKAVLRDPRAIEAEVTAALDCPCTVSIG